MSRFGSNDMLCMCVYMCHCIRANVWTVSGLSFRSGQVLCMCFPCPDGLSAGLGRGGGCPPALPPSHCRRSTRPCRLPAPQCRLPDPNLPAREKKAENGIESQFLPSMSLGSCIYNNDLDILSMNYIYFCTPSPSLSFSPSFSSPLVRFISSSHNVFPPFSWTPLIKNSFTAIAWMCVCSVRCQEGVETHRWSGGFHSVRSGSEPTLRLVGLIREAPPTGFWADLHLTQRLCFVTERHTHPGYHCFLQLLKTGMSPLCAPDSYIVQIV